MQLPSFGTYRTERTLGTGSFATVWLAHDPHLDAPAAIKVLADNWSRDPDTRNRFLTEARILRRINHPAIVTVHTVGELESGQPWFVMEWADRGTLEDRLERGDPIGTGAAVRLGVDLLSSLQVVHDLGVVHRDVKPSNILFRSLNEHEAIAAARRSDPGTGEQMLLGDFGLARSLHATGFTRAAGTPSHMAPEQQSDTIVVDARADLYAVGVILDELLTTGAPAPAGLAAVVARLRAERPDDRPRDALTAIELLSPWLGDGPRPLTPLATALTTTTTLELRPADAPSDPSRAATSWREEALLWLSNRPPVEDRAEVATALDRWRTALNTGRIRFADRQVADAVIATLEKRWAELG